MKRLLRLVCLLAAAGCTEYDCTLLGCSPVLEIHFANPVAFPFRVELTTPDNVVHTRDCADATQCPSTTGVGFDVLPVTATVKVITLTSTVSTTITPQYEAVYPNGRRCGPACTRGVATVAVPAP